MLFFVRNSYFLYLSREKKILTQFKERDWNEIERKSSYWFILKKSISIVFDKHHWTKHTFPEGFFCCIQNEEVTQDVN